MKSIMSKINNMSKKQKNISLIISLVLLICGVAIGLKLYISNASSVSENSLNTNEIPTLSLICTKDISVDNKEEFYIDVALSLLPANIYPAASISIQFDKNKLEFIGVKKGSMETYGDKNNEKNEFSIPTWDCNIETCNSNGIINTMYLDNTAGKFAYNKNGFDSKSKNIVLKLGFKLKEEATGGEKYDLNIKDAVFATVNRNKDNTSLSSLQGTLETVNCKIKVER